MPDEAENEKLGKLKKGERNMPNKNDLGTQEPQNKVEPTPNVEPAQEPTQEPTQNVEPTPAPQVGDKTTEPDAGKQEPAQEPNKAAHSVDDYMLKEDFDKRFTPFAEKIDALIGKATQLEADKKQLEDDKAKLQAEIEEAKKQKAELDEKIKGLQDKYENNSFGNVAHGGEVNPSDKTTKYVSYDEYMNSFGLKK